MATRKDHARANKEKLIMVKEASKAKSNRLEELMTTGFASIENANQTTSNALSNVASEIKGMTDMLKLVLVNKMEDNSRIYNANKKIRRSLSVTSEDAVPTNAATEAPSTAPNVEELQNTIVDMEETPSTPPQTNSQESQAQSQSLLPQLSAYSQSVEYRRTEKAKAQMVRDSVKTRKHIQDIVSVKTMPMDTKLDTITESLMAEIRKRDDIIEKVMFNVKANETLISNLNNRIVQLEANQQHSPALRLSACSISTSSWPSCPAQR